MCVCVFYICFDHTFIELISSALNIYKLLLGLCENVSQQLLTLVAQKLQMVSNTPHCFTCGVRVTF